MRKSLEEEYDEYVQRMEKKEEEDWRYLGIPIAFLFMIIFGMLIGELIHETCQYFENLENRLDRLEKALEEVENRELYLHNTWFEYIGEIEHCHALKQTKWKRDEIEIF